MEPRVFEGRRCWRGLMAGLVLALGMAPAAAPQAQPGASVQPSMRPSIRSFEDFLAAQGTYCVDDGAGGCKLLAPPVANFLGWTDEEAGLAVSVDYAGLARDFLAKQGGPALGTEINGVVIETPLPDGRADVRVLINVRNALTWVIDGFDFAADALRFGSRPVDVLEGMEPALGDGLLQVRFINTAPGAPLPDLVQLAFFPAPGQELRRMSFEARAYGPVHQGIGVGEGTRGWAEIDQSSVFSGSDMGILREDTSSQRIRLHVSEQ